MDFVCDGCGKYHYIPPESKSKQDAIDNLELVLDNFQQYPWMLDWMDYHEPEMMRRLRNAINDMLNRRD